MDSVGVNVIETAALGRPFQLGMLYDCRKDALVPAITLWDEEQLQKSIREDHQIHTDFKVTASDSIEEKSSILNIDSCLELSLLGGLLHVGGAAKYLNDTKKSFKQQRLTLHYHSTSTFKKLSMDHLASGNIAHHEVFKKDIATHVVTAVLYGADACFVFDREVSSDENESTVAGEVQAAYDKLKGISVGANIDRSMNDNQKTAVQRFSCTFYGDFKLPSNPASFEDALKVYAELPKLLGENKELVVPVRVWLYPLNKLDSRPAKLQRDISIDLIKNFELVIESLSVVEMKCSDLQKDTPALTFTAVNEKIENMKRSCHNYKLSFVKKLGILLPKIRGDLEKDTALTDLLQEHEESLFRKSDLEHWLNEKEKESDVVKTLLRQLKDCGAEVEINLDKCLMDLEVKNLVCYNFTSLKWPDVLLSKHKDYLSPLSSRRNNESTPESQTWLTPKVKNTMRSNLKLFKNLIDSKDRKPARFIIASKEMENNPGSCLLLYENGRDEAIVFPPPSKQEDLSIKYLISALDLPSAVETIKEYLKQQDLVELNIGVTGESGSGKSTFVNAFRGLGDEEEGSAETGVVETTTEPEAYLHPRYKNMKVWDLPCIGSPNFKADEYLKRVQFERYDFFIIIASDRFRECHTQLAKEITRMGKRFYFVRSKIDSRIGAEKKKRNFDLQKTLDIIREDCEKGLRQMGIEDPVVFLISCFEIEKYDLNVLQDRMEKVLPQHERRVLMLAFANITLKVNEKKKALEENIDKLIFMPVCAAAVMPTYAIASNIGFITGILKMYYCEFGLDDPSLQRLCERSGKTVEELKRVMKSPFYQEINEGSILSLMSTIFHRIPEDDVNSLVYFIPIVGNVMKGRRSYVTVSKMLKTALDEMAEDAKNVLMASLET